MTTTIRTVWSNITLALLAAFLLSLVAVSPASAAVDSSAESEFVKLINQERTKRGLGKLVVRSDLVAVARDHSETMARESSLHHNPTLGQDVTNWVRLTENVGVGPGVVALHDAFMASSGHRANILDSQVTEIGVGVFMQSSRMWVTEIFRKPKVASTSTASTTSTARIPLVGDWNGDGTETPGWFTGGTFKLSNRLDGQGTHVTFSYGRAQDLPLVGDWNGDGKDTIGIVRDGEWHLRNSLSGGAGEIVFTYGRVGTRGHDIPLVGDWNGDGDDEIGIVRDGEWHLRYSLRGGAADKVFTYGRIGPRGHDLALVGDWDKDGRDTVGIVRDGEWHLRNTLSGGAGQVVFTYGRVTKGDLPLPGDWDGDGGDTPAVTRDAAWHFRFVNAGGTADASYFWAP